MFARLEITVTPSFPHSVNICPFSETQRCAMSTKISLSSTLIFFFFVNQKAAAERKNIFSTKLLKQRLISNVFIR